MLPDPAEIPQEARRQLLGVLAERRRVTPSALGVSRAYFYQMKKGLRPVPDHVLERLLEIATDNDLARVPFFAPYVDYRRVRGLDVDRIVRLFVEWAKANPASAKVALDTIQAEVERLGLTGRVIRVAGEHLEEWRLFLEARVREGRMSPETARERDRYLRRALEDLGYLLGPARVQQYLRREALESPDRAAHEAKALRLFTRYVLGDRELYNAIPSINPRHERPRASTWEEICRVIEATEWPPAKAYLYVLASTGMRPETVQALTVDQVRLGERLVWVWRDRGTKRDYFGFLAPRAAEYLGFYLDWRRLYLERRGIRSNRLFPVKRRRLYQAIYEAMDEALGYRFEPRLIRHRVTDHLAMYLSAFDVNALTGHAPRGVVEARYLQRDAREELRAKYDRAMSSIPCLSGNSATLDSEG